MHYLKAIHGTAAFEKLSVAELKALPAAADFLAGVIEDRGGEANMTTAKRALALVATRKTLRLAVINAAVAGLPVLENQWALRAWVAQVDALARDVAGALPGDAGAGSSPAAGADPGGRPGGDQRPGAHQLAHGGPGRARAARPG
jgi:hypothetical protein